MAEATPPTAAPAALSTQLDLFDAIITKYAAAAAASDNEAIPPAKSHSHTTLARVKKAVTLFIFPQSVVKYLASVPLLSSKAASQAEEDAASFTKLLPSFATDNEFLVAREHALILNTWVRSASNLHLHHGMQQLFREAQLTLLDAVSCLQEALDTMNKHLQHRVSTMAEPPRLVRVARALNMSQKEIDALSYLQVCHCGANFVFTVNNALSPSSVAKFCDLTPQELLHFLAEHRDHMRQGLVQFDSMCRTSLMDSKLALTQEVVAAFTGESLAEEQLIKLEKTSLATVLLAERHGSASTTGSHAGGSAGPSSLRVSPKAVKDSTALKKGSKRDNKKSTSPSAKRQREVTSDSSSSGEELDDEDIAASEDYVSGDDTGDDGSDGSDDEACYSDDSIEKSLKKLKSIHAIDPSQAEQVAMQLAPLFKSEKAKQMLSAMGLGHVLQQQHSNKKQSGAQHRLRTKKLSRTEPSAATSNNNSPLLAAAAGGPPRSASGSHAASPLLSNRVAPTFASASTAKMHEPYTTDIDYIDDAFKLLSNLIKIRNAEGDMKDDVEDNFYNVPKTKVEATIRELKGKFRLQSHIHKARIQATFAKGGWLPRIEQIAQKLNLSEMEKLILLLLVGNGVSHDVLIAINGRYVMRDGQRELNVGYMLFVLCEGLKERVASRKYFYQSAPLIANGLISVNLVSGQRSCFNTDLTDYAVDIDRKIVDYLMGTEMETAEMVPGSKLYTPTVPLENVVLPRETTETVLNTIEHFALFDKCKRQCGFGEGLGTNGSGLVFLFFGPSGTGKTMLANAVAHDLHKKLLLVNLLQFKSDARSPEVLRFIFREAKLNDAVIFFDECETFFETREANPLVTAILAEFEKYDGIIILATNRAQVIDEAMNRRISLMIEFKLPDHQMREKIWRAHLPKHLKLGDDVDLESLALDYELSGGLIRNAVLAAINTAVAREKTDVPVLTFSDFKQGAKQQLRGFFLAAEKPSGMELYVTPKRSLDELIVEAPVRTQLENIAKLSKSRNTLFSQWGFNEHDCMDQGVTYLFHGPSGTGKSLAVEGIAYECGATVRVCNVQELVMGKDINIQNTFEEARKLGAIIVFDNAQVLFDYSERSQQISQLIQYHAVIYPRPVIVVATTGGSTSATSGSTAVDARGTKLQFCEEVSFTMPNKTLRKELWRRALPEKVPLADDVDFAALAEPQVTAKFIRSVCFSACCKVALLPPDSRILTMKVLKDEKEEALMRERRRATHSNMFA